MVCVLLSIFRIADKGENEQGNGFDDQGNTARQDHTLATHMHLPRKKWGDDART
ncbi:hypothetical protein [Acetobacter sp. DmW_136]|uniref:hypothetical protein n=1 Tax=Acetobacter sp. DmW_136 TaxID=2591091 RepID=UPI00140AB49B|nr:hypothetical protein [Acetobacter sp. DmW_136]